MPHGGLPQHNAWHIEGAQQLSDEPISIKKEVFTDLAM